MSANKNTSKDNMKATRKRIAWVTSHPIFILNYLNYDEFPSVLSYIHF